MILAYEKLAPSVKTFCEPGLPLAGIHIFYFSQEHNEQVAASLKKDMDGQIPNYPNLPSKLLCLLHNVTLHADLETDEVYVQMALQHVPSSDCKEKRLEPMEIENRNSKIKREGELELPFLALLLVILSPYEVMRF
ncbi:hypothetical protein HN51_047504, partial [Arachis hypogaea]